MAGYAGWIPQVQTKYLIQGLFSEPIFQQLLATGIMDIDGLQDLVLKGDFITIPQALYPDDFQAVDLTSTAPYTGTRVNTVNAHAPVLRRFTAMSFTEHDDIRTNENWRELLAMQVGNKVAKDVIQELNAALQGALNVPGLNHIRAEDGAITVQDIRASKRLMGDQGGYVDTMLIHPDVWSDLFYDITTNYKYSGNLSGTWLENQTFQSLFGVSNVVISQDLAPVGGNSSETLDSSGSKYYTYLFKKHQNQDMLQNGQPIYFGYQRSPSYSEFLDSRVPSSLVQPKWNMDFVLGVRGMSFTSSIVNPAKTDLATSANWSIATSDTRNVGVVAITSRGAVQG
jgi:hypothetical protein